MLKFKWEIIFLIALFLSFAVSSTYSIMRKGKNANTTIAASSWNVSLNQTGINDRLEVIPNSLNASYIVKVNSNSEVDVVYDIVVNYIPQGVQVKLDNGSFQTPAGGVVTFSNAGNIAYNDVNKEKTHTLTFKALSTATASQNNTIGVDVIVRQAL